MQAKIVCFKLSKTMILLCIIVLVQIIFILFQIVELREEENFKQIQQNINELQENSVRQENQLLLQYQNNEIAIEEKIQEKVLPEEKKGYPIIGKIEIPKLKLDTYILAQTNDKALKVSVTKLYGAGINEIGNLCIAGHNYRNNKMFGGIKKLEKEDSIFITNPFGEKMEYKVYDTYTTDPKNISCLSQQTNGEREITLITCTTGAIKRVIVKAVEVYD